MSKQRLLIAGSVFVLCFLAVMPVFAQGPIDHEWLWSHLPEAGLTQVEFCVPEAGYCQYYTYVDNEDNSDTGNPDNDMGCSDPPQCMAVYRTCQSDAKHPIEFNIAISAITYNTDAIMLLGAKEPARQPDIARVEFNGALWEVESEDRHPDRELVLWAGHIDPALVQAHPNSNLVKVYLRSGECLELFNAWLLMTDWPFEFETDEEFVPEPSTILLLGSGLMGLAGYATLRWRTRE